MFNMKTGKNFFSKVPSLFLRTIFTISPKDRKGLVPTCTHLYNKTSPKRKLVESFLGFSFPLVRSCTNIWWFVFRDATLKGNPTNTSRPAWNVKGQQLGVIVSYVSGLPSSRTRRHRVRRGGKRWREWHGMTINGWFQPTKQGIFGWLNSQSESWN